MKMTRLFFVIAFLIVSIESQENGQQKMEDKFGKCCGLGKSWADEGLRCDKFVGPVSGVSQVEQGLCLEAVNICCVRAYHEKSCDKGKKNARGGLACSESSDKRLTIDDNYQRDCCEGCRLGILTGSMGQGCNVNGFSFGKPWDPAFLECCNEIISPSTVSSGTDAENATTLIPTSNIDQETETDSSTSTSDFDLSLELMADDNTTSEVKNICEILKGLLCSHICVPTEGSYRCECPEGMTLLEDAKTCRTEDSKRCILENPCEHRCNDSGKYVKCECNPGFILSDDNHSCQPITTTTEATTKTITTTKKSTSPPSVKTTQKIQPTTTTRTTLKATTKPVTRSNEETNKIETTQSTGTTKSITKITTKSLDKTSSNVGKTSTTPTTNSPIITKNTQVTRNTPGTTKSMQSGSIPKCPAGYRYESSKSVCDDVDECAEGIHACGDEICYNQPGGYTCARAPSPITEPPIHREPLPTLGPESPTKCNIGLKYVRNRGCMDINECEESDDACSSNEECINNVGSFTCDCKLGFRRDNLTQACVDINECQFQQNDCLPTQRCDNTLGSYICVRFLSCGTGYTLNAATESCEDDDECILGTHDCSKGYFCRNTLGSYRCDRNSRSQQTSTMRTTTIRTTIPRTTIRMKSQISTFLPSTTTMIPTIQSRFNSCPRGFSLGNSGQCIDIDECQNNPCTQSPFYRCINTIGSYRCMSRVICNSGYKIESETSSRCIDIDECADGSHKCGPDQTCENRQGGYACACPRGFTPGNNNNECLDIDECTRFRNVCGGNGRCKNTKGSFTCVCEAGFEKLDGGNICQDINECENNPQICQHNCVNNWGSYRCVCNPGFRLNNDNRTCSDVDECLEFKENNLCVGFCDNTPGSYSCRCPDGYRLGVDGRTCQDIDECSAGLVCRDPNDMCQNTRGGYKCNKIQCQVGYHRDHERKNRCVRTSRYCPSGDLSCFRSPSHFSYNFITFVSMFPIPQSGQLELFTMRGTHLPGSIVRFSKALVSVRTPPGLPRATESYFVLQQPSPSEAVLCLTRSIAGPQEIELELSMEIYHNTAFAGSAVAKLFIYVTQYEF